MRAETAATIRSRAQRLHRKAAQHPDIIALLEEGRRLRADLDQQAKDSRSVARIQWHIARRLGAIQRTRSAASRARMLGELADWLSGDDIAKVLARAVHIRGAEPKRRWLRQRADSAANTVIKRLGGPGL